MSAAKTLAFGLLMTATVATTAQAGSIDGSRRVARHPDSGVEPTSLGFAGSGGTHAAENLAGGSGFGGGYAWYAPASTVFGTASTGNVLGTTGGSALGTTNSYGSAPSAGLGVASAPAPSSYAPTNTYAAPAYAAPSGGSGLGGLTMGGATSAPAPTAPSHSIDAYINFGNGAYSESQALTTGTPQAWYTSQSVQNVFHGTPTAGQQAGFIAEVLQTIQHTYAGSGLNVSLTTDPNQNYAHTMSVVSGASYNANPNAIGITDVGNDGFSFIDKFGQAKTADELATAIGHNLAHELMHAFGIANHPDQTGTYLDAATASWSVLTNANTTFSPEAAQLLAAQNFLNGPGKEFTQGALGMTGLELLTQHHPVTCHCPYCNALRALKAAEVLAPASAAAVPEPSTMALWGIAAALAVIHRRRKRA